MVIFHAFDILLKYSIITFSNFPGRSFIAHDQGRGTWRDDHWGPQTQTGSVQDLHRCHPPPHSWWYLFFKCFLEVFLKVAKFRIKFWKKRKRFYYYFFHKNKKRKMTLPLCLLQSSIKNKRYIVLFCFWSTSYTYYRSLCRCF